jgi:hypothetical protein
LLVAGGGVACGRRVAAFIFGEIWRSSCIRRCSWIRWCSLTHGASGGARGSGVWWGEVRPPRALSSTPAAPSPSSPSGCAPGDGIVAGRTSFSSLAVDGLSSSPSTAGAACPGVACWGGGMSWWRTRRRRRRPGGESGGGSLVANPAAAAASW